MSGSTSKTSYSVSKTSSSKHGKKEKEKEKEKEKPTTIIEDLGPTNMDGEDADVTNIMVGTTFSPSSEFSELIRENAQGALVEPLDAYMTADQQAVAEAIGVPAASHIPVVPRTSKKPIYALPIEEKGDDEAPAKKDKSDKPDKKAKEGLAESQEASRHMTLQIVHRHFSGIFGERFQKRGKPLPAFSISKIRQARAPYADTRAKQVLREPNFLFQEFSEFAETIHLLMVTLDVGILCYESVAKIPDNFVHLRAIYDFIEFRKAEYPDLYEVVEPFVSPFIVVQEPRTSNRGQMQEADEDEDVHEGDVGLFSFQAVRAAPTPLGTGTGTGRASSKYANLGFVGRTEGAEVAPSKGNRPSSRYAGLGSDTPTSTHTKESIPSGSNGSRNFRGGSVGSFGMPKTTNSLAMAMRG